MYAAIRQGKAKSGMAEELALLWQIPHTRGFPNRWFGDSCLIGFWRADQWTWTGKRISSAGRRISVKSSEKTSNEIGFVLTSFSTALAKVS